MTGNNELLARIDERLKTTSKNIEAIHKQTTSMDDRLRSLEVDIKELQTKVKKIPDLESDISSLNAWRQQLGGSWKAIVILSLIVSAISTALIQIFKGD